MPPLAPRHPVAVQGPTDPANLYSWVTWDRSDPAVTKYEVLRDSAVVGTVGPFVPFNQSDPAHRDWRTAGYPSAVLADSPAYYFRLEQTGSSMTDSGPNGLVGATEKPFGTAAALPNTTGPITGHAANNAKTFNGTDERFVVANNAALDIFTGAWSIELWVKRSATQAATQNLWQKGTGQPLVKFHTDNKVRLRKNGTGDVTESTIAITDQLWHHIVVVKPATGDPLIYIDGVDRTGTQLAAGTTYVNTTSVVSHAGGSTPFPGSLDEPAVYGTALSAARVTAHFNAATASPTRPFDDTWNKCAFKDTAVTAGQTYRYAVRAFVGAESTTSTALAVLTVTSDGAYGTVRQVAAPSGGDDTTVLQTAINTAEAEGGIAVLQTGTYKFSQLTFKGSRMVLRGQGEDVTFLRPIGPGGAGTGTAAQDQIVISGSRVTLTATLSQAIAVGSTTVTLSATNELSVGSVVIFVAPNVGGTATAAYGRGDVITPGVEYDEINRWECNEVTAISGTSVTFKFPFSQPIPTSASIQRVGEATVGVRQRGLVFERFTIEGVSATDSTYFTHFDVDGVAGIRWADVRARHANGNVAAIANSYDATFVDCDEPHHGTAPAQTIQYSISFARAANGRVIACSFGTDGVELVKSPVSTQRAPRTLVRHSVFHWPANYACNEHGGGSRDWIFENCWFNLGTNTEYAGVFVGNPDFANAGRGIVRNNRQDRGPILVYGREHSYGVRVLDNIAYDLASNALSLAAALVVWGGWDAPAEQSANWGAARLAVKRNAVFGSTGRGLLLGRRSSTYFGDGTAGNPDPAADGGGYLGVKDAIVENNHLDVTGTAVELLGTSTTTNRFQVRNSTGRVSFIKPGFVTGDHWENNGDGELFGSATAVGWADEFFAWETTSAAPQAFTASLADVASASDSTIGSFTFLRNTTDLSPVTDAVLDSVTRGRGVADTATTAETLARHLVGARAILDAVLATDVLQSAVSGPIQQFKVAAASGATASITLDPPIAGNFLCVGYHFDGTGAPAAPAGWERSQVAQVASKPTLTCFYYRRVQAGDPTTFSLANSASANWALHAWELAGISLSVPFDADSIAVSEVNTTSLPSGSLTIGPRARVLAMLGVGNTFVDGSVSFSESFIKQAESSTLRSASARRFEAPAGTLSTTATWINGRTAALTLISFKTSSVYEVSLEDATSADDTLQRATSGARALGDAASLLDAVVRSTLPSRSLADVAALSESVFAVRERSRSLSDSMGASEAVTWIGGALRDLAEGAGAVAVLSRLTSTPRSLADVAGAAAVLEQYRTIARLLPESAPAADVLTLSDVFRARHLQDLAGAEAAVFAAFALLEARTVLPLIVEVLESRTEARPEPSRTFVEVVLSDLQASLYH